MKRKSKLSIAIATAVLAVLGGTAVYAQDKYSLKSPDGITFSDFKGYEDWAVVSSARTDEVLKMCQTSSRRLSSSKRTARDFRKAADGDTRCSTTKLHPTSSRPIPAPQIADTRAMWP